MTGDGDQQSSDATDESLTDLATSGSIAQRTARGAVLLTIRTGLLQILQFASSLAVARFVAPSYYGTFAVGLTAISFVRYLGDLGVSTSFLPLPKLDNDTLRTGALISLASYVLWASVIFASAPLLASLLHGSRHAVEIIRLLSLGFLFETPRFGPNVRLGRNLAFGRSGLIGLAETFSLLAVQFILILGFHLGVWALVWAQVARGLLGSAYLLRWGGGIVLPARRRAIWPIFKRAYPYQATAVLAGFGGLCAPLLLAAALDARHLGYYAWSTTLTTPVTALVTIVSGVTLPSLARLRTVDPTRVNHAADLMLRASLVITATVAGVLLGMSGPLVHLLYGHRWLPALTATRINLVGIVPSTLSFFLAAILESDQRPTARFSAALTGTLLGLPIAYGLAVLDGPAGAALALGVLIPALDVLLLSRLADVRIGTPVGRGLAGFALASGMSLLVSRIVHGIPMLVGAGFICGLGALAIVWTVDRHAIRNLLRLGVRLPRRLSALLNT
jgi:O-antigen/teichoic acid export membrane protein